MAKLTLKNPPQNANAPKSWIQNRYAPPQAPTFFDFFSYQFKRLARVFLISFVILVAFLALPFRKWDNQNPAIQSCAMSVFGLSLLLNGKTNEYCRVAKIQKNRFEGSHPLLSIHEKDYLADCPACDGKGKKLTPCPACTGPKTCPVCKGTGKTKAGEGFVPCEACRRRPPCAMCKGEKKIMAVCPECRGMKKMFKVSDDIKFVYVSALSNMLALCAAELAPEPDVRLTEAQAEPDNGIE